MGTDNETETITRITDRRRIDPDTVTAQEALQAEHDSRENHPSGYAFKEVPTGQPEDEEGVEVPVVPKRQCAAAFLVIVEEDGSAVADPNYTQELEPRRPANFYDMIAASTIIQGDVQASKSAQISLQLQMQAAQQLQRQHQDQQLGEQVMQKLHGPKG